MTGRTGKKQRKLVIYVSANNGWMVMGFASTKEQNHMQSSHFFQWMVGNLGKAVLLWLVLKIHLHSWWNKVLCPGFESFTVVAVI